MKKILLIITLFYIVNLNAQSLSVQQEEDLLKDIHFTIDTAEGKPLTVNFRDGRVAVLRGGSGKLLNLNYQMLMNEMTCNEKTYSKKDLPQNCFLNFQFQNEEYKLVWLRHPDASKVGKEVTRKSGAEAIFDESANYSSFDIEYRPSKTSKMRQPNLKCQNFNFGDFTPDAGQQVNILEFIGDSDGYNSETKRTEKRNIEFGENIGLKFVKKQEAEFSNLPKKQNFLAFALALFPDANLRLNLVFPNQPNEICQLSVKSKIDDSELRRLSEEIRKEKSNEIAISGAQLHTTLSDINRDNYLFQYFDEKKHPNWVRIAIRLKLLQNSIKLVGENQVNTLVSKEVE